MKKLFGTDGIRGIAGQSPLDAATIYAIGLALAHHLGTAPRVLLGMDSRESGEWIAATLTAGLCAGGASVESAGVITTPAIAFLTRTHGFSAGVVISASHNPWRDNGVKIFGADGYKLADSAELAIEQEIFSRAGKVSNSGPPPLVADPTLLFDYAEWLRREMSAGGDDKFLCGVRIVVDCANGAAFNIGPQLLESLGADVIATHASPSGRNINEN